MAQSKSSPASRRMIKPVVLVAALGFGIKSLILHPIYIQLASNISYLDAWYTNILYYLIDGGLIDLGVFAVCYPATVYAVWKDGLKESRRIITAFSLITLCKFLLNYIMSALTDTGIPDLDEFFRDLPPIFLMLLLELLQYAMIIAILWLAKRRYESRLNASALQAELTETEAPAPVLPFVKLFSLKNPLQFTAFLTSVILFLSREVGYHVYQITLYVNFGSTDGWADMLLNLIGDMVIGVLIYFAAILLLTRFHSKERDSE